jgi:peptide/nickel transport system permease protein
LLPSVPAGLWTLASGLGAFGVAVPNFWLGSMLVLALVHWRWLPATGYVSVFDSPADAIRHMLLPTRALGASAVAEVMRQLRSALRSPRRRLCAHGAGQGRRRTRGRLKHALRNALIPIVTVTGLTVSRLMRQPSSSSRSSPQGWGG